MNCTGDEDNLLDCPYDLENGECGSGYNDAIVMCIPTDPTSALLPSKDIFIILRLKHSYN